MYLAKKRRRREKKRDFLCEFYIPRFWQVRQECFLLPSSTYVVRSSIFGREQQEIEKEEAEKTLPTARVRKQKVGEQACANNIIGILLLYREERISETKKRNRNRIMIIQGPRNAPYAFALFLDFLLSIL